MEGVVNGEPGKSKRDDILDNALLPEVCQRYHFGRTHLFSPPSLALPQQVFCTHAYSLRAPVRAL